MTGHANHMRQDHEDARRHDVVAKARYVAGQVAQGGHLNWGKFNGMAVTRGGAWLYQLARMARDAPSVFKRCPAGDFTSVPAAALQAVVVRPGWRVTNSTPTGELIEWMTDIRSEEECRALIRGLQKIYPPHVVAVVGSRTRNECRGQRVIRTRRRVAISYHHRNRHHGMPSFRARMIWVITYTASK